MARTCKAFKNPALNILWRKQRNITNLINCMPADLWETVYIDGVHTLKSTRELVASDWERISEYAGCVKHLICQDPEEEGESREPNLLNVYAALSGEHAPHSFLPNLGELSWYHRHLPLAAVIQFLLGPRELSIDLGLSHNLLLVDALAERFPHLVSLTVQHQGGAPLPHHNHLLTIVRALARLDRLTIRTHDVDMLRHVGNIKTLRTVDLVLEHAMLAVGIPDRTLFSHLEVAKLEAEDMSDLVAFVRTINSPHLRSFNVDIVDALQINGIDTLYQSLAAHCTHAQLRELEVNFTYSYLMEFHTLGEDPQASTSIHNRYFFHHLFPFSQLTAVVIGVPYGYDLDDGTLSDIARAWPNLEKLVLGSYASYVPQCTLLGLYTLGTHCPRLSAAELTLDASNVPTLPTPPAPPLVHRELVSFDAAFS
ncbi:hypothetical protein DFH06DRAFT_1348010 [Mycena polygramma]|nr:hypothetical protein DFH06DRAFT_1348010 [Mycena polygramma]